MNPRIKVSENVHMHMEVQCVHSDSELQLLMYYNDLIMINGKVIPHWLPTNTIVFK